ncbi:VOC family protein [Paenibacillus thermotolerans]|uniref:VOC family protein n=1 Tax=Paenibacillus thermotolerans TaxID=3027807 RepID=UPI002367F661|nr:MULTISPECIES: VOC family protein [unclassified Paenibacillus]
MRIREVVMYSHDLGLSKAFYTERLGLSVSRETAGSVSFQAGDGLLTFRKADGGETPYYHFAFRITEHKWEAALDWLEGRGIRVTVFSGGQQVVHSRSWNSRSYYFFDFTGNIVELIARHDIPSPGSDSGSASTGAPFGPEDITGIGEIGMPAANAPELADKLMRGFSLPEYLGADELFVPVGDPYGLFIVSSVARRWLGSDKPCAVYPLEAVIAGPGNVELRPDKYPYVIRQTAH